MIMKILIGLEKRGKTSLRPLTKRLKKNKSGMKNKIIESKNTLDGIKSQLEGAKEQISDQEDRVMKSNQAEQRRGKKYVK